VAPGVSLEILVFGEDIFTSMTAAAEALKQWDGGCVRREESVMEVQRCHPGKIFENIGAYLCSLVHFLRPVQQKMYSTV